MTDQIKIVIADDHSIVRQGLRQMLDADANFTVVGEAKNGAEALNLIEAYKPDIAVLDIDMPQMNGFELVREVRGRRIKIEIVFLRCIRKKKFFKRRWI